MPFLFLALLAFAACGDDGDSTPQAVGGRCGNDTQCQQGLVCELELCHQPCTTDSTCAGSARCVRGVITDDAGTTRRICQLEQSTACEVAIDCLGKQVCGGGECRDECTRASDCASDQTCGANDRCYSKDPAKDPPDGGV